jgi:hypothetical protein
MVWIAGQFPPSTPTESHSINVSERKTPEQMARDIERRLLPKYREALAKAEQEQARDQEAISRSALLAGELALRAGDHGNLRRTNEPGCWCLYVGDVELSIGPQYTPSAVHPDDPPNGRGVVRIERGSLTAAQARAVILALREVRNG